jgi:thymidylate synthase (FAD)
LSFDVDNIYNDGIGHVKYVQHMGTDLTIVNSARVSFGKQKDFVDDKDKRLIKYLVENKHTSTFEHNVVTFKFCVPLFVRSQHHRHRTWSYNEISRRYTDVDIRFYEPGMFRTQHKSNRQASNLSGLINPSLEFGGEALCSDLVKAHHGRCMYLYNNLIEAGVCREQARGVLPQNMYTEYYGTVNLNNLLKFIDLRMQDGAQWEIQQAAKACLEVATDLWPIAIESYRDSL